jgi:bacillithiol synthase
VIPQSEDVSTTVSRFAVDVRRFPWIRKLAADYVFRFGSVADLFPGNPADPFAWRDAVARTQQHPRLHGAIADIVQAQQRSRGAPPEALAASRNLRDERTVAVVTGQQAGLFGGPLFTLLKALSAIELAERVASKHSVPAVAVFWIDAEDHDWNEVKSCGVLDRDLQFHSITVGNAPGAGEPVARVRLEASITGALAELNDLLGNADHSANVLAALRDAYAVGASMVDAFARWMESVLGPRGLVVFDSSDPAAKPLVAEVFAREVESGGTTAHLAGEAGAALVARGYHAQVTPQDANVSLFHLNSAREPIRVRDDGFAIGARTESKASLRSRVLSAPHEFSPNVLLRPLVQDTLFPTVCYVAGPNELSYLAQLRGVYDAFGIPMPLIQPRASVTILDAAAMRFLSRYNLPSRRCTPATSRRSTRSSNHSCRRRWIQPFTRRFEPWKRA